MILRAVLYLLGAAILVLLADEPDTTRLWMLAAGLLGATFLALRSLAMFARTGAVVAWLGVGALVLLSGNAVDDSARQIAAAALGVTCLAVSLHDAPRQHVRGAGLLRTTLVAVPVAAALTAWAFAPRLRSQDASLALLDPMTVPGMALRIVSLVTVTALVIALWVATRWFMASRTSSGATVHPAADPE